MLHARERTSASPILRERDGGGNGGLRYPPREIRIFLVAAVCAMPGALAGMMANLFLHFTGDSAVAAIAGATLAAILGGRMEAFE